MTTVGGPAAGSETVQLYVSKPNSRIFRPLKERKGFAKVRLEPGESRVIDRNLTFGEMKYGRSPLGWLLCAVLTGLLNRALEKRLAQGECDR